MIILNAAVSSVGFHLMSVSRGEARQVKESEERLFAFLEHADDLIQINARDDRFIYATRAWLRGLGYLRADLPGLSLSDLVHPDSLPDEVPRGGVPVGGTPGRSREPSTLLCREDIAEEG